MYERLPETFPRPPYLLKNVAKGYYDKGQFRKALSLYQAIIRQTPLDEETQKGVVMSLIEMDRLDEASEYLEGFLAGSPDSLALVRLRAYLMFHQGRYLQSFREYERLAQRKGVVSEDVYKLMDDLMASLPHDQREDALSLLKEAAEDKDVSAIKAYILSLILYKDYKIAIGVFEKAGLKIEGYSHHLLSWIAWAYFKTGEIKKARSYYNMILSLRPDYMRANIGLAYCLSAEGRNKEAIEILRRMQDVEPRNIEVFYARAYVFERAGMFWSAIKEYDHILELYPKNPTAQKLRLRALSDLGASSLALDMAIKELPDDIELHKGLTGDMAVDRIYWKEPIKAMNILSPLLEEENTRARFDYIVALAENEDMEDVIREYERLIEDGISVPWWILENVAKAYLYIEEPEKALELYNKALEMNPTSYEGGMGKFYTLQELRKWKKAREVLNSLDREQPEVLGQGKYIRPNWPKLEIKVARGWLLTHEERLREAEKYFWNLREKAPANTGIRTGLAHVYLWRGWPRKALREFKIIETLDPKYHKALIGKAITLNTLAFKEEAREVAGKLQTSHPKDKHVQRLVRGFEVEEMRELVGDFVYYRDEDGFEDIRAEVRLTQPVTLYTDLYGFMLWQKSSEDEDKEYYRRAGIGIRHTFNSAWGVRQQFSIDYDTGGDFGSLTSIDYTPDDYWSFRLLYDTFSTDVPLRARVLGIEADKLGGGVRYRESEWREYNLSLSRLDFSDGNNRDQALLGYEQGLYVKNNWRMRLFLDLYTSRNTRDDAPYFNPEYDLSVSATHMTEYTHWRIYNRAFLQRLFLSIGAYKQKNYNTAPIWSIRYEHDHDFSDTQALLLGATVARNVYDGEPVHSYALYLTYRGRF